MHPSMEPEPVTLTLGPECFSEYRPLSTQRNCADCLDQLLQRYATGQSQCAFIPSLEELAETLGRPILEVHEALQQLRKRGYDFFLLGTESHITLWYPAEGEGLPR